MRGKGTNGGEGLSPVRGKYWFGIITYVRDCYVRDYYVRDNYVVPCYLRVNAVYLNICLVFLNRYTTMILCRFAENP